MNTTTFRDEWFSHGKANVLAGLTSSFALVPECIAFALVAQLNPLMGLYGAFFICTITALFGGRPGMISGAAGSMAVVIVALVAQHGAQYFLLTVVLSGVLMLLFGALRMGKLIRMVPHPVMLGFVNGLAIVIAMAQFEHFKQTDASGTHWLHGTPLLVMAALVAVTMLIVYLLPRLTRAIPPALAAIVGVAVLSQATGLPTRTLGDMANIAGGLPMWHFPEVPLTLETLRIVAPYAVLMAIVGLLETLLTLNLTDEITETRGQANRECLALGAANVVSGLFGGMGGCAMIGQSVINVSSGARGRLSALVAGLFLLVLLVVLQDLLAIVPVAALTAVMIMVSINTFSWRSLLQLRSNPMPSSVVMLATVGTVGAAAVAAPAPAEARGIGPGIAFGLAAGALTAGAIAATHPYYGYDYYGGPGYYYGPPVVYAPGPYAYYGGPYYRHHRYYHHHW